MIRWSPASPLRPRCPHSRLLRLISHWLPAGVSLGTSQPRPWASANFVGARHSFQLLTDEDEAAKAALVARLNAQLETLTWPLSRHIVADAHVSLADDGGGIALEILTVEE